jgi:RHS repeat-associated protein
MKAFLKPNSSARIWADFLDGLIKLLLLILGILLFALHSQAQAQTEAPASAPSPPRWTTPLFESFDVATASSPDGACRIQHASFNPTATYGAPVKMDEDTYGCNWVPLVTGLPGTFNPKLPSVVQLSCANNEPIIDGMCMAAGATSPQRECEQSKSSPPTKSAGNPICLTTGQKIATETDYATADGLFGVTRFYRSNAREIPTEIAGFGANWNGIVPGRLRVTGGWAESVQLQTETGALDEFAATDRNNLQAWGYYGIGTSRRKLSLISTPSASRTDYFFVQASVANGAAEVRMELPDGSYILYRRSGAPNASERYLVPVEKGDPSGYKIFYDYPDIGEHPNLIRDSFGRQMTLTWRATKRQSSRKPNDASQAWPDGGKVLTEVILPDTTKLIYSYGYANAQFTYPSITEITYAVPPPGQPEPNSGTYATVTNSTQTVWGRDDRLISVRRTNSLSAVLWGRDYLYENAQFPYALTGMKDQNGNRLSTYSYSAAGLAASTELAGGVNRYTVTHANPLVNGSPDYNNITREVTGPLGRVERYQYYRRAYFAKVNEPRVLTRIDGLATSTVPADATLYGYIAPNDDDHMVTSITDKRGNTTSFTVDPVQRRPTAITNGAGTASARTTNITWHPTLDLPTRTEAWALRTDYVYTAAGQLLSVTETDIGSQTAPYATGGQTRTTSFTWGTSGGSTGRLLSVNGPKPVNAQNQDDITTFVYDSAGNMTSMTNALGHVTSFAGYDANGRPASMTDPNGIITQFTYDGIGRTKTIIVKHPTIVAQDAITTFDYDVEGRITGITLPATAKLFIDYNLAGQVTSVRAADGERIDFTNDAMGNVTQQLVKRTNGTTAASITRTFDSLGRMLTQTLGPNRTMTWQYDTEGNPTKVITPRNNATDMAFDPLNRLVSSIAPDTGSSTITYTPQDDTASFTDPLAVLTTFVRNGFGEVIQEASPDRGTTTYYYDAAGDVTARIDGRNQRINYTRDILGRTLTKTPVGLPAAQVITYTWDTAGISGSYGKGRLATMVDSSGTTRFKYDHRGNMTQKQQVIGTTTTANLLFTYDLGDRITQITYPSGRLVGYVRDAKGRVTTVRTKSASSVTAWTNIATGIAYEPFGAMRAATYGNGTSLAVNWGNDGRLASRRLFTTSGGANRSLLTYGYDNDDNIISITDGMDPTRNQNYAYDSMGRLIRSDIASGSTRREDYAFDKNGNRTSVAQRANPASAAPDRTMSYARTAGTNRLSGITATGSTPPPARSITYDGRGNTVTETRGTQTVTAAYDGYGRLTAYSRSGAESFAHGYNGMDDRVSTATSIGTTSTTRRFLYDMSGRVLGEYGASSAMAEVKAEFIWLSPDAANDNSPHGGADGTAGYAPLAVAVPGTTAGTTQLTWVHGNHLGVPQLVMNAAGTAIVPTGYSLPGYPGQSRTLADLYYNRYRDYDSSTGRYIQADPIGLAGGSNLYAYAGGNPIMRTDPKGLFFEVFRNAFGRKSNKICRCNSTTVWNGDKSGLVFYGSVGAEGYLGLGGGVSGGVYGSESGKMGLFATGETTAVPWSGSLGYGGSAGAQFGVATDLGSFAGDYSVIGIGIGPVSANYSFKRGDFFSPISGSIGPSINLIPWPPLPGSGHYSQGKTELAPRPYTNLDDC